MKIPSSPDLGVGMKAGSSTNPTVAATRRYVAQFATVTVTYVAVLFSTVWYVNHADPHGTFRYLLLLAPLAPIAFTVPIGLRYFRDSDELEQRVLTESLAIAGGITALLSVTYAFLENTGLPHLSAWWTWTVAMGSWAIARIALNGRYR